MAVVDFFLEKCLWLIATIVFSLWHILIQFPVVFSTMDVYGCTKKCSVEVKSLLYTQTTFFLFSPSRVTCLFFFAYFSRAQFSVVWCTLFLANVCARSIHSKPKCLMSPIRNWTCCGNSFKLMFSPIRAMKCDTIASFSNLCRF